MGVHRRVRYVAVAAAALSLAAACAAPSPTPTGSVPAASPPAIASPSLSPSPSVVPGLVPPEVALVGWRNGAVVVATAAPPTSGVGLGLSRTNLVDVDPESGRLQPRSSFLGWAADGVYVTDGSSVAWLGDAGGVNLARSDGTLVTAPSLGGVGADDWIQYRLVPLAHGGYLLADASSLDRLSSDGQSWQPQPLPAGYVALAGTSDASWFVLARQTERDREGGTLLGSSISLFNAQTHALIHVVGDGATNPSPAVGDLLEYLFDHTWYRVSADGRPQRIAPASPSVTDQSLSPDGLVTAGGCPAVRTLSLPVPIARNPLGFAGALAAETAEPSVPGTCPGIFGPVGAPRAAPELAGTDLDGWAWAGDDRVAAIVDLGNVGSAGAHQVLVIETPGAAELQVPLPTAP